jgi:signal transduction histidine kinase
LFQNLISNGIKYRSAATPVIRVSAEVSDGGWIFSVVDNGMGIDPKYFEYIFGVFRRLQGPGQSGAGIGLSICRAAAERLGGRIWVESAPGAGSKFRFWIPNRAEDQAGSIKNGRSSSTVSA